MYDMYMLYNEYCALQASNFPQTAASGSHRSTNGGIVAGIHQQGPR